MRSVVLCAALGVLLFHGEFLAAADIPPAVQWSIPDLVKTRQKLAEGPWGLLSRRPEVEALRKRSTAAPEWRDGLKHAMSLRVQATVEPWHGGLPVISGGGAVRMPAGRDPQPIGALKALRDGGWWLFGAKGMVLPNELQSPGDGHEDMRVEVTASGLAALWPVPRAAALAHLAEQAGADRITDAVFCEATGLREELVIHGARPGLRAIDPAALAGMPTGVSTFLAVGLDGTAFAKLAPALLAAYGQELSVYSTDFGVDASTLAKSLEGTVAVAILPDDAGWVATLPANETLDAVVAYRLAVAPTGGGDLAAASEQPIQVIWPGLGTSFARRTAHRWYLGTDPGTLNAMATPGAPAFPLSELWPEPAGAQALVRIDGASLLRSRSAALATWSAGIPGPGSGSGAWCSSSCPDGGGRDLAAHQHHRQGRRSGPQDDHP